MLVTLWRISQKYLRVKSYSWRHDGISISFCYAATVRSRYVPRSLVLFSCINCFYYCIYWLFGLLYFPVESLMDTHQQHLSVFIIVTWFSDSLLRRGHFKIFYFRISYCFTIPTILKNYWNSEDVTISLIMFSL